jgi:20S proteasome alpha/beta subunit
MQRKVSSDNDCWHQMTVAIALVCEDGALLASDSMGTSGALASMMTKMHACSSVPLVWTWAGSLYLGQQVGRSLRQAAAEIDTESWVRKDPHTNSEKIVASIRAAVKEALDPLLPPRGEGEPHEAEFLVAGFTTKPFVAHVKPDLARELANDDQLMAIGSGHEYAGVTRSLMRHYIEGGLTLEQAKGRSLPNH